MGFPKLKPSGVARTLFELLDIAALGGFCLKIQ